MAKGKTFQLGGFQKITAVHWGGGPFAAIEQYTITSNSTIGTLLSPAGEAMENPVPNFGFNPNRFSPSTVSVPAPYAFPPTDLMKGSYDAWADDLVGAFRSGTLGDSTIHVWVVNCPHIFAANKNLTSISFQIDNVIDAVGALTYKVSCRLFRHIKWRMDVVDTSPGYDFIGDHDGPVLLPQIGQAEPFFTTEISRDSNLSSSDMLNANNPQQFFNITINKNNTASVEPFA